MKRRLARESTGAKIQLFHDPVEAMAGAHVVYTDTWVSMGQEFAAHLRSQIFAPYRVTETLMAAGRSRSSLHALPSGVSRKGGRGGGDRFSAVVVYDQAENRLHVQKALLLLLLQNGRA